MVVDVITQETVINYRKFLVILAVAVNFMSPDCERVEAFFFFYPSADCTFTTRGWHTSHTGPVRVNVVKPCVLGG